MKQENYLEGIYGCLERIEKKVETAGIRCRTGPLKSWPE